LSEIAKERSERAKERRASPNEMPPESGVPNEMFQWRKTLTSRAAELFESGSTAYEERKYGERTH
jgi:hypothetical protein